LGKKKKTSTTVTETVITEVVKLTYLQTLAFNQNLIQTNDLNTEGSSSSSSDPSKKGFGTSAGNAFAFGDPQMGLSKKKSKTSYNTKSTGVKVKESWLQPYFDRIAYKVGLKELNVSRYTFVPVSEFTSVPFTAFKEIVKLTLIVDEYVPPQFDQTTIWMKYYVKIEGEDKWVRINPLNKPTIFDESGLIVPRIINYNLPKPGTAQIEDKYQYTEEPVTQVRFKAVLGRPDGGGNEASMTPMLKSYRLTMVPRI